MDTPPPPDSWKQPVECCKQARPEPTRIGRCAQLAIKGSCGATLYNATTSIRTFCPVACGVCAICAGHKECEALLKDAARHGGRPRTPPSQRRGGRPRAATAMSSMASPETSIQRSITAETSVAETSVAQSDVPSLPNRASSREVVEELSHFQALASADL